MNLMHVTVTAVLTTLIVLAFGAVLAWSAFPQAALAHGLMSGGGHGFHGQHSV